MSDEQFQDFHLSQCLILQHQGGEGVRGFVPWSLSIFWVSRCQMNNFKTFILHNVLYYNMKKWRGPGGLPPGAEAFLKIISCWDFTSIGVIVFAPWSWSIFKITSHQISNSALKMWDVTSMGVRGLAPWSWSYFEITDCQISNWKHFRLKTCDFTRMGVRGLPLKHFWNHKLVGFYFNGGHGACPLKLKHFEKYKLSDKRFEIFQP